MPGMNGPRHMSHMVPEIAGKALGKKGLGYGKLVSDWGRIVGPELAASTTPAKLAFPRGERNDATLTIEIVPARAIEAQHWMPSYRTDQCRFRLSRCRADQTGAKAAERTVRMANLRPLSPSEERDLAAMTDTLPDGELRAALESLGRAVTGTRK